MGYITWEQHQRNQQSLRENSLAWGADRRKSPPGEGPVLLQGMVLCGVCGQQMTVRHHTRKGTLVSNNICQRDGIAHAERVCQSILSSGIDTAISTLLMETLTPMTLEVALAVQQELQQRLDEADHLRHQHVERARYEAELARERFLQVDPKNRLVADALEADWNNKLRALIEAQEQYERQRQADRAVLDKESQSRILALATDFPRLWKSPKTPDRERKRMVRLLIEDITLSKGEQITVEVRFRGGTTRMMSLPPPQPAWAAWQTSPEVIAEVDRLLNDHTETQIAVLLNERGWRSGTGRAFTKRMISQIRCQYRLKSRYSRLREAGMLIQQEIADQLGIHTTTVHHWRRDGLLKAHAYHNKPEYLYETVGTSRPVKRQGLKRTDPRRIPKASSER